ncbi:Rho GTPase-activating protein [Coemansia sp. Benny D115]|nr:Rho GTPase-activating protein [Coemansia sp. Benny D115]
MNGEHADSRAIHNSTKSNNTTSTNGTTSADGSGSGGGSGRGSIGIGVPGTGVYRADTGAASIQSGHTGVSNERQSHEMQAQHHSQLSVATTTASAQRAFTQVDLTEIDETVAFFKTRAKVEEEYGRSLQKLAQSTLKMMDRPGPGQSSTQHMAWQRLVEVHETLASNRMKFSITLMEMSDYLNNYVKAKEGVRRRLKETEQRYQKAIEDTESLLEKARLKYEMHSMEWEKLLVKTSKTDMGPASGGGSGAAVSKTKNVGSAVSGIFGKHKGSTQESLERLGQEAGVKAKMANEAYKRLLQQTNAMRRDFYDLQLPKILASVMGLVEEVDQFLKFSLGKYAYTYESAVLADAITLKPMDANSPGMVEMVGDIDSKADLDVYLQATAKSRGRVNCASIPYKEYEMSAVARLYANPKHIFGVPLDMQLERDQQQVPLILVKCTHAVEAYGLQNEGIYRQSGQSSQVQKLRNEFDLDAEHVDLSSYRGVADINNIASVLKMYLRELPGGLVPQAQRSNMMSYFPADELDANGEEYSMQAHYSRDQDLILAQKISGLADTIRGMPLPNKNTLAFLFMHLDKVQAFQEYNMMNSENLSIVFGPTIFPTINDPANAALDIRRSAKLVKFILDNRKSIFEVVGGA